MNETLNPGRIVETGLAFWSSKTLLSAIELGVFANWAKGAAPFETLRGRLGLYPRSARDFFDALVARGFPERASDRSRTLQNPTSFLDHATPSYAGGFLEMVGIK